MGFREFFSDDSEALAFSEGLTNGIRGEYQESGIKYQENKRWILEVFFLK